MAVSPFAVTGYLFLSYPLDKFYCVHCPLPGSEIEQDELGQYPHAAKDLEQRADNKHVSKSNMCSLPLTTLLALYWEFQFS